MRWTLTLTNGAPFRTMPPRGIPLGKARPLVSQFTGLLNTLFVQEEIEYYEVKNSDLTIHKNVMPPSCIYQPFMFTKQYLFVDDKSILCSH